QAVSAAGLRSAPASIRATTAACSPALAGARPTVTIGAPADGTTVSGTVSLTADASSGAGIASVQFTVDGAGVGVAATAPPYAASWDTTALADGTHTVSAVATDAAGLTATAPAVTVTVRNGPAPLPLISRGAPAFASSTSYPATNANDDDGGTFWRSD